MSLNNFKLYSFPLLLMLMSLSACSQVKKTVWIQGKPKACEGFEGQTQCLMISEIQDTNALHWDFSYEPILDFKGDSGKMYLVELKVIHKGVPAPDEPAFHYKLMKVIREQPLKVKP